MKKFLLIISSTALFLSACSDKKEAGVSERTKKNLETNRGIMKMFETNDWSKAGDYIAKDAVDHASMTGNDIVGLDSIKANFNQMSAMMSDMKNDVIKELADDDYVMSWVKQTATAKMDMPEWGMKAGQAQTFNGIEVSKYNADGKVTEHWSFADTREMMKMMSGMNMPHDMEPTVKDKKDSTSK
jgi:predicted SnoaL-like aldol condensation-catalyzing enzyme